VEASSAAARRSFFILVGSFRTHPGPIWSPFACYLPIGCFSAPDPAQSLRPPLPNASFAVAEELGAPRSRKLWAFDVPKTRQRQRCRLRAGMLPYPLEPMAPWKDGAAPQRLENPLQWTSGAPQRPRRCSRRTGSTRRSCRCGRPTGAPPAPPPPSRSAGHKASGRQQAP
jgi:hypothetical protein